MRLALKVPAAMTNSIDRGPQSSALQMGNPSLFSEVASAKGMTWANARGRCGDQMSRPDLEWTAGRAAAHRTPLLLEALPVMMANARSTLSTSASNLRSDLGHAVLWPARRLLVIEPHLVRDVTP